MKSERGSFVVESLWSMGLLSAFLMLFVPVSVNVLQDRHQVDLRYEQLQVLKELITQHGSGSLVGDEGVYIPTDSDQTYEWAIEKRNSVPRFCVQAIQVEGLEASCTLLIREEWK
ncbi:hypothetical protein [Aureibacillus halotolerans]|uniref:Competence protein ComGE n=1 Tax=Aureibacillus halotolerans TaxID=1508390 RepID=A0A4R6UAG1_9BACI|nr:hypothetical protein [Aureibacillus halotolerans]TDQ41675.1 hypothetical protein EV213_103256 [Aureibacillus halotolerans]